MDLIDLAERGRLPDWLIRHGMRQLLRVRLRGQTQREAAQPGEPLREFIGQLRPARLRSPPTRRTSSTMKCPAHSSSVCSARG